MTYYSPDVQKAIDRALEVKAARESELFKLPGVHAVSVQPKTTKGVRTPEFAIVVDVVRKKPASELKPGEMVPPVIDGVSTDVVESAPRRVSALPSTDTDTSNYPYAIGGAEIASDGMVHTTAAGSQGQYTISWAIGTLGCIAINTAATNPSKKAVALSCAHVLLDVATTTVHDGSKVGQPDTSSLCCKSLDHTIGHMDQDAKLIGYDPSTTPTNPPPGIDAGFVTLDPGVQWQAQVITGGEGGSITTEQVAGDFTVDNTVQLWDTTKTPAVPVYAVHKRGARTEATLGWLISISKTWAATYQSFDKRVTKKLNLPNQLEIQPQDPTKFFALQGDSGSALLNSSHQVIGLVDAGAADTDPPTTTAFACPIGAVQTQLGVKVADSTTYPGMQTVPKAAAAFAALPADRSIVRERLDTARAELGNTPMGQQLDSALHLHFREIRVLVNSNRRTAAVWRRIRGAAWMSAVLNCLMDRGQRFPAEIEGRSLSECLDQLVAVLERYGSQKLVSDLAAIGPELSTLAGRSYDEMLAAWRIPVAT